MTRAVCIVRSDCFLAVGFLSRETVPPVVRAPKSKQTLDTKAGANTDGVYAPCRTRRSGRLDSANPGPRFDHPVTGGKWEEEGRFIDYTTYNFSRQRRWTDHVAVVSSLDSVRWTYTK